MVDPKPLFFVFLISFSPMMAFSQGETISIDFGKLYKINYQAKDITIFEVIPNPEEKELIFEIDVSNPLASLEITIPRDLLDSTENGNDSDFFIIADGREVTFSEKDSTKDVRTLFMELSPGTTELEIFGTVLVGKPAESLPSEEENPEAPQQIPESTPEPSPAEEIPQEQPSEPQIEEPSIPESTTKQPPEETKENKTPSETSKNFFDFSKIPKWSIAVNENQMRQFIMTAGTFVVFVILLAILKGLRTEKSHGS